MMLVICMSIKNTAIFEAKRMQCSLGLRQIPDGNTDKRLTFAE